MWGVMKRKSPPGSLHERCVCPGRRDMLLFSTGIRALLLLSGILLSSVSLCAHGGGLDSFGCHHNRKSGGYHCHRGPLAGQSFGSKSEALKELRKQEGKQLDSRSSEVEWRRVTRVIDGDTIVLDGRERVRLIGVDTPETVHPNKPIERFGKEASAFTGKLVAGKRIRLEYDQVRTDRYGRTLAYVFLKDGMFLNAEIIKRGYGFAYTKYPFRHMENFCKYEKEAREAGRGLWGNPRE